MAVLLYNDVSVSVGERELESPKNKEVFWYRAHMCQCTLGFRMTRRREYTKETGTEFILSCGANELTFSPKSADVIRKRYKNFEFRNNGQNLWRFFE